MVTHKIKSVIFLIILLALGYWGYGKITSTAGDTRYITSKIEKGTIISSISGSGQVSASNQIDIKSKVSGDVIYITSLNGKMVTSGTLIAQLDARDAQKLIRDAEINLENAKLSLEKLKIQNSDANLNSDLIQAYDDGFNTVSSTFIDMPSIITGLENLFANQNLSENNARNSGYVALEYRRTAETSYYNAKDIFEKNRINFRLLDRYSNKNDIENIINETYETTKAISDALKNLRNFVDYIAEDTGRTSDYTSSQNTLSTYISIINGHLSNLLSIKTIIKNNKDAFPNASLDIQSSELSVKQKENALQDAKDKLTDYFIRVPFDGTIASVDIKKSDSVSSNTIIGTIITKKQLAEISLNEVDVAKIKIGDKTTLTFDAIDGLNIAGKVEEIDSVGTVSQGVVTYNVKISFDTQDERVKSAMSVSATIITAVKDNVLIAPNSGVKSKNGSSYVEMFSSPLVPPTDGSIGSISIIIPNKISVQVGVSNDSQTEIISGLKEGDKIVTRTILPTTTTTASTPSMFGSSNGGNKSGGIPRN
ncbi:MAG: HlyD family efflux transporter periplasmic adaptor subunit [Candidatus Paceibacterota bacterium]|jgi:HlyD family secretion protein